MLARLSSSDYPALAPLKTRDDDDFSIAFLDATSVVLDILTFYQERLANESYLRTATQLDSLTHLSRLIGFQPSPGVAASTYLAFTLKAATGLPANPGAKAITIPAGTQAQSVPGQGQSPQSFETSANILAKADWNAMPVRTGAPWVPKRYDTGVYLAGTSTQLVPGDAILIVGDERLIESTASQQWDVRTITSVEPDAINMRTYVTWGRGLYANPPQKNPRFFALRQRSALFGYNAINPTMLAQKTITALYWSGLLTWSTPPTEWDFGYDNSTGNYLYNQSLVDLDAVYSKLTSGGWLVMLRPDADTTSSPSGFTSLFAMNSVTSISRSDYSVAAKITRIATDTSTNLSDYYSYTRSASILTQSEELIVAEQPLDHPLYGTSLDLEGIQPDLIGIKAVAISGKSQKLIVKPNIVELFFRPDDGSGEVTLKGGDVMTLLQPPNFLYPNGSIPPWRLANHMMPLTVLDSNGRSGALDARLTNFFLATASKDDPIVQEFALVSSASVVAKPTPHTRILLESSLRYCYDRTVTTVNANVGPATAGGSVMEMLGSGFAAIPNQVFTLKQKPLTFVQAATPSGRLSSLQVRASGIAWTEGPSLYNEGPSEQVFATLNLPGGSTKAQFGDGVEGATLPTGQNNIQASYRVGIGSAGNVGVGSITTLVDRPLGVSGVNNPLATTGGQDAQSAEDLRANAPLSVLTLGRAVSITDYQNFAATFAGIAKANAIWIPSGAYRGVFLTVAGAGGAALPPGNPTLANLVAALEGYGNPNVPIFAQSFLETLFRLSADLRYDPAYDSAAVKAAVRAKLTSTYSFAARTFGQGVSGDEIAALIQAVPGVIAVNVTKLRVVATSAGGDLASSGYSVSAYNNWLSQKVHLQRPHAHLRICAYTPVASPGKLPQPAEILVLDPDPKSIVLGVMV